MSSVSQDGKNWELRGLATSYNAPYSVNDMRGQYSEMIKRGAFAGAIDGRDTVAMYFQHNHDFAPIAMTPANRGLAFTDRSNGLQLMARLPKNETDIRDAVAKVKRGLLSGLSVGMMVDGDEWSQDHNKRSITSARLAEVSLVARPANPEATVELMRGANGQRLEVRYAAVRLDYRQANGDSDSDVDDGDTDGDLVECPHCDGDGVEEGGLQCPVCGGSGQVDQETADSYRSHSPGVIARWRELMQSMRAEGVAEARRDFSDKERQQHGQAGKAIWIDGHWAFPTPTREDYDNAVQALGRTPGKNRAKVRRYLIKRARQEGWPIPSSWNSDGTTKSSNGSRSASLSLSDIERELTRSKSFLLEQQVEQLYRKAEELEQRRRSYGTSLG